MQLIFTLNLILKLKYHCCGSFSKYVCMLFSYLNMFHQRNYFFFHSVYKEDQKGLHLLHKYNSLQPSNLKICTHQSQPTGTAKLPAIGNVGNTICFAGKVIDARGDLEHSWEVSNYFSVVYRAQKDQLSKQEESISQK